MSVILSCGNHNSEVIRCLYSCFNEENHLDLIFVCKNKQYVKAHKIMLSSVSDFLKRVLLNTSDVNVFISVPDIEQTDLKMVIRFLYEGKIKLNLSQMSRFRDILTVLGIVVSKADVKLLDIPANTNKDVYPASCVNSNKNITSCDSFQTNSIQDVRKHQTSSNNKDESEIIVLDDDDDEEDNGREGTTVGMTCLKSFKTCAENINQNQKVSWQSQEKKFSNRKNYDGNLQNSNETRINQKTIQNYLTQPTESHLQNIQNHAVKESNNNNVETHSATNAIQNLHSKINSTRTRNPKISSTMTIDKEKWEARNHLCEIVETVTQNKEKIQSLKVTEKSVRVVGKYVQNKQNEPTSACMGKIGKEQSDTENPLVNIHELLDAIKNARTNYEIKIKSQKLYSSHNVNNNITTHLNHCDSDSNQVPETSKTDESDFVQDDDVNNSFKDDNFNHDIHSDLNTGPKTFYENSGNDYLSKNCGKSLTTNNSIQDVNILNETFSETEDVLDADVKDDIDIKDIEIEEVVQEAEICSQPSLVPANKSHEYPILSELLEPDTEHEPQSNLPISVDIYPRMKITRESEIAPPGTILSHPIWYPPCVAETMALEGVKIKTKLSQQEKSYKHTVPFNKQRSDIGYHFQRGNNYGKGAGKLNYYKQSSRISPHAEYNWYKKMQEKYQRVVMERNSKVNDRFGMIRRKDASFTKVGLNSMNVTAPHTKDLVRKISRKYLRYNMNIKKELII